LDDVAAELVVGVHEFAHPVVGIDHPARQVFELVAEDVADLTQRRGGADRACTLQRPAYVAGGPHELRLGIADLEPGQPAPAQVPVNSRDTYFRPIRSSSPAGGVRNVVC